MNRVGLSMPVLLKQFIQGIPEVAKAKFLAVASSISGVVLRLIGVLVKVSFLQSTPVASKKIEILEKGCAFSKQMYDRWRKNVVGKKEECKLDRFIGELSRALTQPVGERKSAVFNGMRSRVERALSSFERDRILHKDRPPQEMSKVYRKRATERAKKIRKDSFVHSQDREMELLKEVDLFCTSEILHGLSTPIRELYEAVDAVVGQLGKEFSDDDLTKRTEALQKSTKALQEKSDQIEKSLETVNNDMEAHLHKIIG